MFRNKLTRDKRKIRLLLISLFRITAVEHYQVHWRFWSEMVLDSENSGSKKQDKNSNFSNTSKWILGDGDVGNLKLVTICGYKWISMLKRLWNVGSRCFCMKIGNLMTEKENLSPKINCCHQHIVVRILPLSRFCSDFLENPVRSCSAVRIRSVSKLQKLKKNLL